MDQRFTTNFQTFKQLTLASLLALTMSACSGAAGPTEPVHSKHEKEHNKSLFTHSELNGHKVFQLDQDLHLASSETLGLFLFDRQGQIISSVSGNYEGLDVREVAGKTYVISINKEQSQAEIFTLQQSRLVQQSSIELTQSGLSNLCLYQPVNSNSLQAILLTEAMTIEQRLILDSSGKMTNTSLLRTLPAPPNSVACASDDVSGQLYLAEELVGVWSYPLDLEAELTRKAIVMTTPHGTVEGEIKDVAIDRNGRLFVALPDMASILVMSKDEVQDTTPNWHANWVATGQDTVPESVTVYQDSSLLWYDKETDQYLQQTIGLSVNSRMMSSRAIASVVADGQTEAVNRFGDAADDPAIWANRQIPEQSRILATDKTSGLYVYDLNGNKTQFIASGRVNNVDISEGFTWHDENVDLAAASNRTNNSISLYVISSTGVVTEVGEVATSLANVYGLCSYRSSVDQQHYVFINDENGSVQQYRVTSDPKGIKGEFVRQFEVPSQPEGCVVDSKTNTLYIGEEGQGIWKTSAEANATELELVIEIDNQTLFADVEGLAIYQGAEKDYLVVSSQGSNSYVLYDLSTMALVGDFRVIANYAEGIDGASETDGLAVSSANFGGDYKQGLLVVQDGRNMMPNAPQNFKLIGWSKIQQVLSLAK